MFNFFNPSIFVDSVSTYASEIDFLIGLIFSLVFIPFIISEILLFTFIFKFRKKSGVKAEYIEGESVKEKRWISIPHYIVLLLDVIIIIFAIGVWVNVKQDIPEPDRVIEIEGRQWAWNFRDPGMDGKLGTSDDIVTTNVLNIEVDKVYNFKLKSVDVLHDFSVPVFRLKQDAIPGREITGWFKAKKTGEYDIQCAEMCGIGHGLMSSKILIKSKKDFTMWLKTKNKDM
tara:strand:+ start:700 stop:1386 length:687 start_codon:yes stop_codon:yes gene_type:complete